MKLTPFAKIFIALIILSVVGYVLYTKRDSVQQWANTGQGGKPAEKPSQKTDPGGQSAVGKDDFSAIGAAREAGRSGVTGVAKPEVGSGKLGRKLVVGINTWAGHAPGIIANAGLAGGDKNSIYLSKYGLEVEFKLLEDPQTKLAAFIKGDIDIMWDTVDSWAREASALRLGHRLFGPALMTFLLLRVSGVAMLEKTIGRRRPGYEDYVRKTSAFFPRPPRRA